VVTCGGPAYVLRNEGGNQNGWAGLELHGTKSNRDAIGAKVKLVSESGRAQYGMVTTTAGYQSAQDKRLYFGIGHEKTIRTVEITWPSGARQTIENPPIRKILAVTER
jgi:enediyne biosynthesis protein E4